MSAELSPMSRVSIKASLAAAIESARKPRFTTTSAPAKVRRRAAKPAQISLDDLLRQVRNSVVRAEESDRRPQRPMVSGEVFEPMYRENQRRSDRFSCFLACLTGSLSVAAPEVAAEIYAFIETVHSGHAPVSAVTDQASDERSTPPCAQ